MRKTFIEIAEIILKKKRRPMKPDEIFSCAVKEGLIFSKGKTPGLSMKARISTDLRKNGFSSIFMRTGPNKFALREFGMKEFISQPFKKSVPKEIITCVNHSKLQSINNSFGFYMQNDIIKTILTPNNLVFIDRKIAESDSEYKQLISYVILINEKSEVLTYKRGVYTNAHDMLKGSSCLGFGGHVQDIDSTNMFTKGLGGVFETAEREVYEELKGFKPQNMEVIGFINDDSSPEGVKHLGIVLQGILPNEFKLSDFGKELSINDLRFMSIHELWTKFYEFEFWSQLIIRKLFPQPENIKKVVIKPSKFNITSNVLVFVGEIASGKTILCDLLKEKHGFKSISTRKCVAKLIHAKDFGISDRSTFQRKAEIFINKKDSPFLLANEIKSEINAVEGTVLIDGIRHFETLKELRLFFPELIVIYVDSTRDDAYRNFLQRSEGKASLTQFRVERHHPVEKEIKLLKGDTDAYVFNGGNKDELYSEFINWFNMNRK